MSFLILMMETRSGCLYARDGLPMISIPAVRGK
jgi:hypothetical protein